MWYRATLILGLLIVLFLSLGLFHDKVSTVLTELTCEESSYLDDLLLRMDSLCRESTTRSEIESLVDSVILCADSEAKKLVQERRPLATITLFDDVVHRLGNCLGQNDPIYVSSLRRMARYSRNKWDDRRVDSMYEHLIRLSENVHGDSSSELAGVLVDYAFHCQRRRRLSEAEELYSRAENILVHVKGADSPEVAEVLSNASSIYIHQKQFPKANAHLERVLSIYRNAHGENQSKIVGVLTKMGERLRIQGRFAEAETRLLEALQIADSLRDVSPIADSFTDLSPNSIINILTQLGKLYIVQVRYREADRYLKRALRIVDRLSPASTSGTRPELLNEMGNYYMAKGQNDKAERYYQEALLLREQDVREILETGNPNIAEPLNNLGELCLKTDRLEEARSYYRRALDARMDYFGPEAEILVYSLIGLGEVYREQGDTASADSMFSWALRNVKSAFGQTHQHISWCLSQLGGLRFSQGDYATAESLYADVLSINKQIYGSEHPEISNCYRNLALVLGSTGEYANSVTAFRYMKDIRSSFIHSVFSYASQQQKLKYAQLYPLVDDAALSLAMEYPSIDAIELALEMVLQGKAAVLDAMMAERKYARCSLDADVDSMNDRHTEVCSAIASLTIAGVDYFEGSSFRDSLAALNRVRDSLEVELSWKCTELGEEFSSRKVCIKDVANRLPEDAVLWEIYKYQPYDFGMVTSTFSLVSTGEVALVDLGKASAIDSLVTLTRQLVYGYESKRSFPIALRLQQRLQDVSSELFDILMIPLLTSLGDRTRILICPDGLLSLNSFKMLIDTEGRFAIEKYNISYLSSGRDLIHYGETEDQSDFALVMGCPDYDLGKSLEDLPPESDLHPSGSEQSSGMSNCFNHRFVSLEWSESELDAVVTMLCKRSELEVHSYRGVEAREEVLKDMRDSPRIVHLTTHGFSCEDLDSENSLSTDNPLLRFGLALAGANVRKDRSTDGSFRPDDGILTAFEASGLNLESTELAVLSACETGLGEVSNGEGVFGLRRAFQHAGAQAILMSLWNAPDKETTSLMEGFYSNWLSGMSKQEALRVSSLAEIEKQRAKRGFAHPYFWAAFVLTGDPY